MGFLKVDDMNAMMLVVDKFSKYTVFVATPLVCTTEVTTKMFYRNMVKYFGFSTDIVSDRDARFTNRF